MSFICWRWMCMPLTNTASAHSKSSLAGGADVLVDEADRPVGRQIGRDQQQPLRRHERLDAVGQRIGVFERAERRRVAREDAQDAPYRLNAFSSHQTSSSNPELGRCRKFKHDIEGSARNSSRLWRPVQRRPRPEWLRNRLVTGRARTVQAISRDANSGSRPALPARRKSVPARPTRSSQSSNSGARFRPNRSRT